MLSPSRRQPAGPVDVHAHGIPRSVLTEIEHHGDRFGGLTVAASEGGPVVSMPGGRRPRPLAGKMLDFEQRLGWLDQVGLHGQVVSPWLDLQGYELEGQAAADWAAVLNDGLAQACGSSAGRLAPLATLPFGDAGKTARELERAVRELGMRGAMLSTNPGTTSLADPGLEDVWATAEALGAVIVLHPPTLGPASHIPESQDFGNLYHRLVDTTFVATRLILAGLFDRHPRLKLVLVHGGGFLPYQAGRLDRSYAIGSHPEAAMRQPKPSDYLRSLYYDTCLMAPSAIRLLCDLVGADRVVLGSDYPFPIGDPDPVGSVRSAELEQGQTEQILAENPATLLAG